MLNTLFIGCGGAGSNITEAIKDNLGDRTFCKFLTIDTSNVNQKEGIDFTHIKSSSNNGVFLKGSGGLKGENLEDIKKGVSDFIDANKLHQFDGVIFLVFSSNGASGNVIANSLLKKLLENKVSVSCLIVHGTTSKQFATQALSTVREINKIAESTDKAVTSIYFLNDTVSLTKVNEDIVKELELVLRYHDVDNLVDIDAKDMQYFYKPKVYSKLNIPAGLYGICALPFGDIAQINEKYEIVIGRAITQTDDDPFKSHQIPQYKLGSTTLEGKNESILLLLNNFKNHYGELKKRFDAYDKDIKIFKIEDENEDDIEY